MQRRGFLRSRASLCAGLGVAVTLCGLLSVDAPKAVAVGDTRTISIFSIHRKDTLTVTYKKDGAYIPEAMKQINWMMRDWRRDEATSMDPELIDLIWQLHRELGSTQPIHLISGFRSSKTNESLRRRGGGQAKKSQHVLGKASDIHFPDVPVKTLRNSALVHEVGGVGFYPKSGVPFVHVDTGRVRAWPRVPRQELAMLFPNGRSQHVPSDGRPLTGRDGEIAMAKLKAMGKTPTQFARSGAPIGTPRTVLASLSQTTPSAATTVTAPSRSAVSLPWMAEADKPAKKPVAPKAQFAMAQFAPLPIPASAPAKPRPAAVAKAAAPAKPATRLPFQFASADARGAAAAVVAQPRQQLTAAKPAASRKTSDRLAYRPLAIEPLMTEVSVSYGSEFANLEHPRVRASTLLGDADAMRMPLKQGRAYSSTPPSRSFSGAAVKNLAHLTHTDTQEISFASSVMTVASLGQ